MPYQLPCPKCKAIVQVPSRGSYGKRVRCAGCSIELAFAPGTGLLVPIAAPAPQVPIPFPSAVPANPAVPVASLVASGADGHAPKAEPVPVAETARPAPRAAIAPAKSKPAPKIPAAHSPPAHSAARSHKPDAGPERLSSSAAHGNDPQAGLDFASPGGIVAKPKLRPPGFIARWFRRIVRLSVLLCLLTVLGGAGTGSYYLLKKWGVIGAPAAPVASGDDQPDGVGGDNPNPQNAVNRGTGNEDPLAYVPADANVIIGISGADLLNDPLTKPLVEHVLVQLGMVKLLANCQEQTGVELKDLLHTIIVALKTSPDFSKFEPGVVVLRSSVGFDQKKIGRWASAKGPRQLNDKYYFDQHRDFASVKVVYTPSDRILVLSELTATQWEVLFDADGSTPALAPDVMNMIRPLTKNAAWGVVNFDANFKSDLKAGKGPMETLGLIAANELRPALQKILPEATGMTFRASLEKTELAVTMGVVCATETHAKELAQLVQASWARNKPVKSKKLANTLVLDLEERQQIVNELAAGLSFAQQQTLVEATLKASLNPFRKLLKDGPIAFQTHVDEVMTQIAPDLGLPPPTERPVELSADEKMLLNLVNQFRAEKFQKLPMKPHAKLMAIARAHAAAMAKEGKATDDLGGKDTVIRVKDTGYKFEKGKLEFSLVAGEKLTVKQAADTMNKAAGKEDIHFIDFADTGIGIAKNAETGQVYYYQILASPEQ